MENQVKKLLDVYEIWEETMVILASSIDGSFLVWAERKSDQVNVIGIQKFPTEGEARTVFRFLSEMLVELTDPVAPPRMLIPHEIKEIGDPDIIQAIDRNPMDDEGRIYVYGSENGKPFLAHFIRGFRDAKKEYFPSHEEAQRVFKETWELFKSQYTLPET